MNQIENKIVNIIKEGGLVHASSRKLPLISCSCIFFGYINILSKKVGYSYKNLGVVGKKDQAQFLINEDDIGKLFAKIIKKKNLDLLIDEIQKEFSNYRQMIMEAKKYSDHFEALKVVLSVYPKVLSQIGFYNSIMRYIKNDANKAKELGHISNLIGKDRDIVANLIYPEIEPLIKKCVNKIGKFLKAQGDLLRYMTLKELNTFIRERKISKEKLKELAERKKNCLYLVCGNKEYVVTDKKTIDLVRDEFIDIKADSNILKGVTAYPGRVTGKVYKAFHGVKTAKPGYVLVTNITKPEDAPLLRKFAAIITNEGGILSHIAVFAREFKIPGIMATKTATKMLEDGDLVEVDANSGVVKILKKNGK